MLTAYRAMQFQVCVQDRHYIAAPDCAIPWANRALLTLPYADGVWSRLGIAEPPRNEPSELVAALPPHVVSVFMLPRTTVLEAMPLKEAETHSRAGLLVVHRPRDPVGALLVNDLRLCAVANYAGVLTT